MKREIFATPRQIADLRDCYFYHEMDLPGYGHVEGEWDLRGKEQEYWRLHGLGSGIPSPFTLLISSENFRFEETIYYTLSRAMLGHVVELGITDSYRD
jgi:hypothetical protein